jgi:hypothetical protein
MKKKNSSTTASTSGSTKARAITAKELKELAAKLAWVKGITEAEAMDMLGNVPPAGTRQPVTIKDGVRGYLEPKEDHSPKDPRRELSDLLDRLGDYRESLENCSKLLWDLIEQLDTGNMEINKQAGNKEKMGLTAFLAYHDLTEQFYKAGMAQTVIQDTAKKIQQDADFITSYLDLLEAKEHEQR